VISGVPLAHPARWAATWTALGVPAPDTRLYEQLVERYSDRSRHYHTLRHLSECIARLDEFPDPVAHVHEIELALWFHDAVYDAHRSDNEEQSAAWAKTEALRLGVAADAVERIHALILATKHNAMPATTDAQLIVDVDLTILGAPAERFDEYERQVGDEYTWVPGFLFRRKRREILESFLARPSIFSTAFFREKYEAAARHNLQRSITTLSG
jgi:predicted metal-dependent HD superfamily phosphohydrolase